MGIYSVYIEAHDSAQIYSKLSIIHKLIISYKGQPLHTMFLPIHSLLSISILMSILTPTFQNSLLYIHVVCSVVNYCQCIIYWSGNDT
jgi:hypothetical protein